MRHDVFISYSIKDKGTADAACSILERNGIRCWMAPRDSLPSVSYAESVINAIDKSYLLLIIFSNNSNQSPQVLREVNRAVKKGIPILPFRIENAEPTKSMEYYLSTPHWLDALTPPMEKHLKKLVETVQLLLSKNKDYPKNYKHGISSEKNTRDYTKNTLSAQHKITKLFEAIQTRSLLWALIPIIIFFILFFNWSIVDKLTSDHVEVENELLRVMFVGFRSEQTPKADNEFGADLLFTNVSTTDIVINHIIATIDIKNAFPEDIDLNGYLLTQGAIDPLLIPANTSNIVNVGNMVLIKDLNEKNKNTRQGQVDLIISWKVVITTSDAERILSDSFYGGTLIYKDGRFIGRMSSPNDILIIK